MSELYNCTFELSCLMEDNTKGHQMNDKMRLLGKNLTETLINEYGVKVKVTPRGYMRKNKKRRRSLL